MVICSRIDSVVLSGTGDNVVFDIEVQSASFIIDLPSTTAIVPVQILFIEAPNGWHIWLSEPTEIPGLLIENFLRTPPPIFPFEDIERALYFRSEDYLSVRSRECTAFGQHPGTVRIWRNDRLCRSKWTFTWD